MNLIINILATYLIFVFPLIGLYFFFIKKDYPLIYQLILALIIEMVIEFIIKSIYFTPRPYVVNHLPVYVTIPPLDSSWPSGHTMKAFALATVIFLKHRRLGVILFVISGLIGLSRVLANVHYPLDIISGLILGVTIGFFCGKINVYARHYHSPSRGKTHRRK